jgi:hypothetical protein
VLVEAAYIAVGCPEDMVDLWHRPVRSAEPGRPDRERIRAFIRRREADLQARSGRSAAGMAWEPSARVLQVKLDG